MSLTCPQRDDWKHFSTGELTESLVDPYAEHLSECDTCRDVFEQVSTAVDLPYRKLAEHWSQVELPSDDSELRRILEQAKSISVRIPAIPADSPSGDLGGDPSAASFPFQTIGEYQIVAKLGEGGMGAVYKAVHRKLDRAVAIKVLAKDKLGDSGTVGRFEREMKAVGRLTHPNIVMAHDAGEVEGVHFLVMEFVDGCDLAQIVRDHGPFAIPVACEAIRQAAVGLQQAHRHQMVHRDIKPSNLMLTRDGVVKVLDLGLALLSGGQADEAKELTSTGRIMGTLDYMAPEQGGDSHSVDIRADVYSLGATLYRLLTGVPPFFGEHYRTAMQKLMALATEQPPNVAARRPDVPADLAALVMRMLEKDPAARPATPSDVAAALAPFCVGANLAEVLSEEPEKHPPIAPFAITTTKAKAVPTRKMPRTGKRVALEMSGVLGALLLAGVILVIRNKDGQEKARYELQPGDKLEVAEGAPAKTPEALPRTPLSSPQTAPAATTKPTATAQKLPAATVSAPAAGSTNTTREVNSSSGSSEAIGKPIPMGPPIPAPPPVMFTLTPEPIEEIQPKAPLRPAALVARPAAIPGVLSWTFELRQPRGLIDHMALSPDGKQLATGSSDSVIRIWNTTTWKLDKVLLGRYKQFAEIFSLSWSANGKYLAEQEHSLIRIWDVESGRDVRTIRDTSYCPRTTWSPNGRYLAFGSKATDSYGKPDFTVAVWDGLSDCVVQSLKTKARVCSVAWSPGGKNIATGESDGAIELWPFAPTVMKETAKVEPSAVLNRGTHEIYALAWSPDGKVLAAKGHLGRAIQFWHADSKELLYELAGDKIVSGNFAWSPSGRYLAGGSGHMFDSQTGRIDRTFAAHALFKDSATFMGNAIQFGLDDRIIFQSNAKGTLRVAQPEHVITQSHLSVNSIEWLSNTRSLAVTYHHYTRTTGKRAFCWNTFQERIANNPLPNRRIENIAYSPGGLGVAVVVEGGICLWDERAQAFGSPFSGPVKSFGIAWSRDGRKLVSSHADGKLRVWNVHEGTATMEMESEQHRSIFGATELSWSPDGERIAVGMSQTFTVWNTTSRQMIVIESGGLGFEAWSLTGATFMADGKTYSSKDGSLVLDQNGKSVASIDVPRVVFMRFTPAGAAMPQLFLHQHESLHNIRRGVLLNGRTAATGDSHGFTWLWDTQSLEPLSVLFVLGNGEPCAISADGHFRCDGDMGDELVYVVQTAAGQETLRPAEFAARYNWKNDPSQIRLTAE